MPVRAVTFDFWFTLFREANGQPRQRTRAAALARITRVGIDEAEAVLNDVAARFRRHHLEHQRTLGPHDAVQMVADHFGLNLDEPTARMLATAFAEAVLPYPPEPIEGALEAVRLAAQYVPVGIISDTGMSPGRYLRQLLDRFGFSPYIAGSVFSDEVGVAKPQRQMFEVCAGKLGVAPNELFHIGDTEQTDIFGARSVGAKSALFTGVVDADATKTTADYVITNWQEFPRILQEIFQHNCNH